MTGSSQARSRIFPLAAVVAKILAVVGVFALPARGKGHAYRLDEEEFRAVAEFFRRNL